MFHAHEIQDLGPDHYTPAVYDERQRWAAYWYQLDTIRRSGAQSILEIGPGSGTVSLYVRHQMKLQITTFDHDRRSGADIIGDVRQIGRFFSDGSYDAILAFQVLEHIPYEDLPSTLVQIARITRRHFLVSVPHCGRSLQVRIDLGRSVPEAYISRKITIPRTWKYNGMHYWEIGARQYRLSQVLSTFAQHFEVKRHYFCPDWAYHYFLECERKQGEL
jgi:predicted SAM-dependent methyltransferase